MEDAFEKYWGVAPGVDLGNGAGHSTKRAATGGLHAWHWGVGLKAGKSCREAQRRRGGGDSALAARVAGRRATWSGIKASTPPFHLPLSGLAVPGWPSTDNDACHVSAL